jgi:hypothetical protein
MPLTDLTNEATGGWRRVGFFDLICSGVFLVVLAGYPEHLFDDPGTGWHLKTGEIILNEGAVPRTDPFLRNLDGEPKEWVANQWLPEAIGAWWRLKAGWLGLRFLAAIVFALTYGLLYRLLLDGGVEPIVGAALCFWCVKSSSFHFLSRPTVISVLLIGFTFYVLWRYCEGKTSWKGLFWLVPTFCFWANSHGGVLAGLTMIAIAGGSIVVQLIADERENLHHHLQRLWPIVGLGVCCFAATLINPYGFQLYTWSYKLLKMDWIHHHNTEFSTLNFHRPGTLSIELAIIGLALLPAIAKRKLSAFVMLSAMFWLHQGIETARFLVIFMWMVMLPIGQSIMAFPWSGWLSVTQEEADPNSLVGKIGGREMRLKPGGLASAIVIVAAGLFVLWSPTRSLIEKGVALAIDNRPSAKEYPYGSIEYIRAAPHGTPIYHHPDWGGFLVLNLWPDYRTYMDDRNEVVGEENYEAFFDADAGRPRWEELFEEYGFQIALIRPRSALRHRLEAHPDWESIHVREEAEETDDDEKEEKEKGYKPPPKLGEVLFWHKSLGPPPKIDKNGIAAPPAGKP